MNAKKIMGAVLVALLAAALFVGAGAAYTPTEVNDGDTVFVYEVVNDQSLSIGGTWTHANGVDTITFTVIDSSSTPATYALIGDNIVEGIYTKGAGSSAVSITVKYPTGGVLGTADNLYEIIGGTYYNDVDNPTPLTITLTSPIADIQPVGAIITGADGIPVPVVGTNTDVANKIMVLPTGTYKIQVLYNQIGDLFVGTVAPSALYGKEVFTFAIKAEGDVELSAAADSVIVGDAVTIVIKGQPGAAYKVVADGFTFPIQPATATEVKNELTISSMPSNGEITVFLKADSTGSKTISVGDETIDIEIVEGEITVKADKESYFIGQDIKLSGTSTGASTLNFYIEGTNVDLAKIGGSVSVDADKTWEKKITYEAIKAAVAGQGLNKLDAGSYTIYVATATSAATVENDDESYTTIVVNLKQPFLTAELKTPVVAQGSDLEVTGTAEAALKVRYYIFGTNYFTSNTTDVKQKDSSFKIKMKVDAEKMAAGQYFLVVQHPMYDEAFNIAPNATVQPKSIILNTTGEASETPIAADGSNILFKVNDRQTSNAAEALCQAIDTENIDDIYVKASFIVAAPSLTMNPVASEIAQGEKLTVSGTTNLAPGSTVTVELLSTAFAAVPKASVNSASFIALTTKVADDGTWEVTFDTTGLNVDEYTLTATAGEFVNTAKVKVVEAAPKQPDTPDTPDVPETPDTPDTPDVPETPGFGALAALAGLGAVAVLLLRRE